MPLPDPALAYPVLLPTGEAHHGTVFLDAVISHPNWVVGAYTYASDFAPPEDWATHLAPYLFEGGAERLIIGKFCQIAHGVRFVTSGANHARDGFTTFPFQIFNADEIASYRPDTRDTIIGNDVWLGMGAIVCPGAQIGDGVIVGAGAVVRGHVPDYAIVTGNPAGIARMRFSAADIARLKALSWWNWPNHRIEMARDALQAADIDALEGLAP